MRFALLAIFASCLRAQAPDIHGTVIEQGPNKGLAGVEVTLVNFVPVQDTLDERKLATVFTDERGKFAFKPPSLGEYRVDVRKAGYSNPDSRASNTFVILTPERPATELRFTLNAPSGMTGRFVDEQDQPLAGMLVFAQPVNGFLNGAPQNNRTDAQGNFKIEGIPPGDYFLQEFSTRERGLQVIDFSDAEFAKTDRDFEHAFWPSGVANQQDALPVTVPSGGTANLGTMRVRKVDYYRVHVNVDGDCSGDWMFALVPLPQVPGRLNYRSTGLACRADFLVTGVEPGNYQFALFGGKDEMKWALEPLFISNGNVNVRLHLAPPVDVPGQFVATEGTKLPSFAERPPTVLLAAENAGLPSSQPLRVSPEGQFESKATLWQRYQVTMRQIPATHYVKGIRYGGVTSPDGWISLVAGSTLEIELDDKPASVTGSVTVDGTPATDRTMVLLARMPVESARFTDIAEPYTYLSPAETGGTFAFGGLAPGEYRILALSNEDYLNTMVGGKLIGMLAGAEKVMLEKGQQKAVELKLRSR